MPAWFRWLLIGGVGSLMSLFIRDWSQGAMDRHTLVGFILMFLILLASLDFCYVGWVPAEWLPPGTYQVVAILYRTHTKVWFVIRHQWGHLWWHREYCLEVTGFYGDDLAGSGTLSVTKIPKGILYLYARKRGGEHEEW